MADPT